MRAMRSALFLLAIGSLLVGCDHRKPAVSDADFKAFKASNPGMTEQCLNEYRYGGVTAWRPDDPECFEMMPAQRWSGVWFNGWEWSNFCAAPAKECPIESEHGDIWLEFAKGAYSGPDLLDSLYRI